MGPILNLGELLSYRRNQTILNLREKSWKEQLGRGVQDLRAVFTPRRSTNDDKRDCC